MRKMRRIIPSVFFLICLIFLIPARSAPIRTPIDQLAPKTNASAVIAVKVGSPDFLVRQTGYKVLYSKHETKIIPITGYDFKSAFTDELLNALSEDNRMAWREASAEEGINVVAVWNKEMKLPTLEAERVLLIYIQEYGAYDYSKITIGGDKFFMIVRFRLLDRATGKRLWEKKLEERVDLKGELAELQADNQKGLKEGINRALENLCAKVAAAILKVR